MDVPPAVGIQGPSFTSTLRRLFTVPAGLLVAVLGTLVIIRMLMPVR